MRGHVRQRGNTYAIVFDEGRDENGRRIQRWRSGFKTEREAERALTDVLSKLDRGDYVSPNGATVESYLAEWLAAVKVQLRPTTWSSYKGLVDKQIVPRIGHVKVQKLTAPALNRMYAEMLEKGRRDGKGGLSPRTVRYCHTVMRKALKDAVGWNVVPRNVADSAQPPKKAKPSKKTWTADEIRRFLDHVAEDRLYPAWHLAVMTGMRRGEILALSWADVDLDGSKLTVRRSLVSAAYEPTLSEPKTERGKRTIALDAGTVAALKRWQGNRLLERAALAIIPDGNNLVFTKADQTAIHPVTFSQAFKRHVEKAKLPKISLHQLRHSHATVALRAGVHAKVISERLGHASVAFTLDTYTDALPDLQETAATLIAELVLGE
jgi:integrase